MNSGKTLKYFNVNPKNKIRLLIFPYAGGSASVFKNWESSLSPEIQICSVQLPGREDRFAEKPCRNVEAVLDELKGCIGGIVDMPYALFGHSLGTLLCYEFAKFMEKAGRPRPLIVFLSGACPPAGRKEETGIDRLNDEELKDELSGLNGIPKEILNDEKLLNVFLPVIRADLSILESYRFDGDYRFSMPVTVFGGDSDAAVDAGMLKNWDKLSKEYCRTFVFPGDHFFIFAEKERLLAEINRELKYLLAA